ncbi:MAG TPA: hypothetical protein VIW69_04370, partial [Candidatus Elarobacter sp.]
MRRGFAALMMAVALVPSAVFGKSHIDDKIQAQKTHIQDVHAKLHQKKTQLGEAKVKVGTIASQLADTNRNIA